VAIHAAHQHLDQLDSHLRSGLSANARSRIVFQTSSEDATFFARGQHALRPEDFVRLPEHEVYASLLAGGHVTPYASVHMLPPRAERSNANELRGLSRQRYGRDPAEVEAELRRLVGGSSGPSGGALGVIRRSS
jgi:hypothetical protein